MKEITIPRSITSYGDAAFNKPTKDIYDLQLKLHRMACLVDLQIYLAEEFVGVPITQTNLHGVRVALDSWIHWRGQSGEMVTGQGITIQFIGDSLDLIVPKEWEFGS